LSIGVSPSEGLHFQFSEDLFTQFKSLFFDYSVFDSVDSVKINLQNGTCEFTEVGIRLREFNKDDNLKYILPFEYNEDAKCPEFDNYLAFVLPDEKLRMILAEYLAYCLLGNKILKLEKVAILRGNGANGKSVFFDIVTALFGKENISHISLKNLTEERGIYRVELKHKLLNYSSELGKNLETTIFKQLVSGEPVDARSLYKSPITIENYARMMFNTNEMPSDVEFNDGFFRRFVIIPFEIQVPPERRDSGLAKRIISNELGGVFNWVIKGMERLLENKGFTKSEAINQELEKFKNSGDSVRQFIEDETFVKSNDNPIVLKELYKFYKQYCCDFGYRAAGLRKFTERIRLAGYEMERRNFGFVVFINKEAA
jgi:putative DNA primase/helicase